MDYVSSVRAALRASAPVVAIPVEGRVPVCIRARLLKGALKGVTIHSVALLENGWLKITGMAAGSVRTSCSFAPMGRYEALKQIGEWSRKEREKRIKVIDQGVLNAQTRRELLKASIEAEAGEVLKGAQKEVVSIYKEAREHVNPELVYVSDERRRDVLNEYSEFHSARPNRKRGAVILWRIKTLKAELAKITVVTGKRGQPKKTYARRQADIPRMVLLGQTINSLCKQFDRLFPPVFKRHEWSESPWIAKRPKEQTVHPAGWWRGCEEHREPYDRVKLAEQLREARANIRALTPPGDEETVPEQIAA